MDTYAHIPAAVFAGAFEPQDEGPYPVYDAQGKFVASFATLQALCQWEAAGRMAHMLRNLEGLFALQADPRSRELARRIDALLEGFGGRQP
jgi:hypothetical protein